MIEPRRFLEAHMECRSFAETIPVLTDLLGFEIEAEEASQKTLKHPNTDWRLVVHEGGPDAPEKQMHNHFGVRVVSNAEVDAAYDFLTRNKDRYGLREIHPPQYSHGSYSLYFIEPGTNGWEIECYEVATRKDTGAERLGQVRAPHWEIPLTSDQHGKKGYVPQAFTHGTLACKDIEASEKFYRDVLGFEIHQPNVRGRYLKTPGGRGFLVALTREGYKTFSPNFRFTIGLESQDAVVKAHAFLEEHRETAQLTELTEVQRNATASFLLRDLDGNCWEIASGPEPGARASGSGVPDSAFGGS